MSSIAKVAGIVTGLFSCGGDILPRINTYVGALGGFEGFNGGWISCLGCDGRGNGREICDGCAGGGGGGRDGGGFTGSCVCVVVVGLLV